MRDLTGFFDSDEVRDLHDRLPYAERRKLAAEFAQRINRQLADENICRFDENFEAADRSRATEAAEELMDAGYTRFGQLLDPDQVADIVSYFDETPCFNAHVVAKSDGVKRLATDIAGDYPFGSYRMKDVVKAPHLLELANHPQLIAAAAAYLGCTPSLYSMNAWWSFPGPVNKELLTQGYHRDEDDFLNCVLFVYLTDSDAKSGAHEYILGTHRTDLVADMLKDTDFPLVTIPGENGETRVQVEFDNLFAGSGYAGDPVYQALFKEQTELIEGVAGEAFMSDPAGLHRARAPEASPRLIAWIRYGLFRNPAYVRDDLSPVPDGELSARLGGDDRAAYINRLIVRDP